VIAHQGKQIRTLIIIPAYNEELNLERVIGDIQRHCPEMDYLIVNDCSTDGTAGLCRDHGFHYIDLYANLGFSGAVQTGYLYAHMKGYNIAVQFDGDGQHSAKSLSALVGKIQQGEADYVIGSRFAERKKPFSMRMLGSRLLSTAIWVRTGHRVSDPTSGLRAVNSSVIEKLAQNLNFIAEPDTLTRALLSGIHVEEVQVDMQERLAGESHFANPINSAKYMVRILLSILFLQGRRWQ
jgi:glycosyltransferase involved in cell wall biosynthesis